MQLSLSQDAAVSRYQHSVSKLTEIYHDDVGYKM